MLKAFYNPSTHQVATDSQAAYAFALYLDIIPKEDVDAVVQKLVDAIVREDYHLTTGNICTKYIFEVLTDHGRGDIALKLATQYSYPSWGYMIAHGATTIWERWEHIVAGELCGMASHNHPMYGTISAWFYKYLAGMLVDQEKPGFRGMILKPYFLEGMDYARASQQTPLGQASFGWEKVPGNAIMLTLKVPFNSQAQLCLPRNEKTALYEGNLPVWKENQACSLPKGIRVIQAQADLLITTIGAGEYQLRLEL
jgi:alpha-L-rhamnosidase